VTTSRNVPSCPAASRAAATAASSVTSVGTNTTRSPSSSAIALPRDDGKSQITTPAPLAAIRRTVASPNPEPPPVTSAT
jgi:hypothetical protein